MSARITKFQIKDLDNLAGPLHGGVNKVNPTDSVPCNYGITGANSGMVVPFPMYAVAVSISATLARTGGTLEAEWTLNGITQSDTALIDGTNPQYSSAVFSTPVALSAGDVVALNTSTTGFAPSNANATLALFFTQRNA